ncbi:MAG: hypothetical protein HWN68_06445 [Desulfobacterales bacterium]|nr:hypothetical protein [Desulfobacterales bacterium]
MKKYEPVRAYILRKGGTQATFPWKRESPPIYDGVLNAIRDRRKLMVTISRRGDVYLSHKENHFALSAEQFDAIRVLRKNLKVNPTQRRSD